MTRMLESMSTKPATRACRHERGRGRGHDEMRVWDVFVDFDESEKENIGYEVRRPARMRRSALQDANMVRHQQVEAKEGPVVLAATVATSSVPRTSGKKRAKADTVTASSYVNATTQSKVSVNGKGEAQTRANAKVAANSKGKSKAKVKTKAKGKAPATAGVSVVEEPPRMPATTRGGEHETVVTISKTEDDHHGRARPQAAGDKSKRKRNDHLPAQPTREVRRRRQPLEDITHLFVPQYTAQFRPWARASSLASPSSAFFMRFL